MSSVYLRRADALERGDIILLAGPVYVRPERIAEAKPLPDGDREALIVELTFEDPAANGEPRTIGFPIDCVVMILDSLEPWPA